DEHPDDRGDRQAPDENRDVHTAYLRQLAFVSSGGLSRHRREAGGRQRRRSWDLVMTTLPRGILPSTFERPPRCGRRPMTTLGDHPMQRVVATREFPPPGRGEDAHHPAQTGVAARRRRG